MWNQLGNLGAMFQQAREVGTKMQALAEELKQTRVVGTAGGGLVEVEVNGAQEVLRTTLDPELVARQDRELLEDLITTAVNQALDKARQGHREALAKASSGLSVPGLDQALAKLLGGLPPG